MSKDLSKNPIKNQKLQALILKWIENYNHLEKHPLYRYKFGLQKILPLPQKLLINAISYIFYVVFPFIIEDLNKDLKIITNFQLKKIYSNQFHQGQWRKQFNFQFTIIFLTKSISQFISQHFSNLQINQNLETQIFIILYRVFIGTEVGTKLYHVTAKKYLKILNVKVSQNSSLKPSICLGIPKKESFLATGFIKQSSKYISQMMHSQNYGSSNSKLMEGSHSLKKDQWKYGNYLNVRRNPNRSKISFIRSKIETSQQKSILQIFTQQLKSNLHVEPLPVVEQKKFDISQYEQQNATKKSKQNRNQSSKQQKSEQQKNKKHLMSSLKKTESIETIIKSYSNSKKTKSKCAESKEIQGVKISLTRQLNLSDFPQIHFSHKKHSLCDKSFSHTTLQQNENKILLKNHSMILPSKNHNRRSLQGWKDLLKQMKSNSKITQKQNISLKKFAQSKQSHLHSFNQNSSKTQKSLFQGGINVSFTENKFYCNNLFSKLQTQNTQQSQIQKIQSIQNVKSLNKNGFAKLDSFTTANENGFKSEQKGQKMESSTKQRNKQNSRVQNPKKLSKTNKLKLAKLQFLSQCKKRQQKLKREDSHNQFMATLIY